MRPVVTTWFARLGFAWARNRLAAETRRELEMHRDLLVERYVRSGMSPDAARTAACRQMGNTTLVAEDVYSMNGLALLDGLRAGSPLRASAASPQPGLLGRRRRHARAGDRRHDRGVQRRPGGAAGAAAVRPARSAGPLLPAGARQTRHAARHCRHAFHLSPRSCGVVRGRGGDGDVFRDRCRPGQGRTGPPAPGAGGDERLLQHAAIGPRVRRGVRPRRRIRHPPHRLERCGVADALRRRPGGGRPHHPPERGAVRGRRDRTTRVQDPILGKPAGAPDVAGDVDVWSHTTSPAIRSRRTTR